MGLGRGGVVSWGVCGFSDKWKGEEEEEGNLDPADTQMVRLRGCFFW